MAAKEQKIAITTEEAQYVIDAIFRLYPGLVDFFNEAKKRAVEQRWLCHCYGRYRRFPTALDDKAKGEFERQAMNFPIQGMIASVVSRAIAYLHDYRERCGNPRLFRILLQIHDAILLEIPCEYVDFVTQNVLPWAMRQMVEIHPTHLDGKPMGAGPYYLGAEAKVFRNWGELLPWSEIQKLGIKQRKWARDGMVVKYAA